MTYNLSIYRASMSINIALYMLWLMSGLCYVRNCNAQFEQRHLFEGDES